MLQTVCVLCQHVKQRRAHALSVFSRYWRVTFGVISVSAEIRMLLLARLSFLAKTKITTFSRNGKSTTCSPSWPHLGLECYCLGLDLSFDSHCHGLGLGLTELHLGVSRPRQLETSNN